ncbi:hypothetical protein [Citrifermentans bremense]|uniref:hypothetical protein n=1 Tax=Citrifermentans bremense TaxID=60035 RepID=UPI0016251B09|nr:hypothetical protein [Citrifermentans bremense]
MKLIFCPYCRDVVKLRLDGYRTCCCGRSGGMYVDQLNAVIRGDSIPLGFRNDEFFSALRNRPEEGLGKEFSAFVIPVKCPTVEVAREPAVDTTDNP